ncbi:MAG: hypothetical protein ACI4JD_04320 [Ruminococcus sp.]
MTIIKTGTERNFRAGFAVIRRNAAASISKQHSTRTCAEKLFKDAGYAAPPFAVTAIPAATPIVCGKPEIATR